MAANGAAIGAGSAAARRRTGKIVAPDRGEAATAVSAKDQTGQQVLGAAPFPEVAVLDLLHSGPCGNLVLPNFDGLPEVVGNDAQMRDFLDDPVGLGVAARDTFAGIGIFDVAQSVPYEAANIELVVQDTGAALQVTADSVQIAPRIATDLSNQIWGTEKVAL